MINLILTSAILTDSIFSKYGGSLGNSEPSQRTAAYAIAEGQAVTELGTFVSPTVVTGTYSWPPMGQPLQLEHTHLSGVAGVAAIHEAGCDCANDSIEIEGCAWIMDNDGGLVSLRACGNTIKASCGGCRCGGHSGRAFQVRIVYTAGLPTAAASDPRLLMALTTAADLALQQIIDPSGAEGGPGDPGVQSYSSLRYSEQRTPLRQTAFGPSARANYAANQLKEFKFNRALKLGW